MRQITSRRKASAMARNERGYKRSRARAKTPYNAKSSGAGGRVGRGLIGLGGGIY